MCIIAFYLISFPRRRRRFRGQHLSLFPHYSVQKVFYSLSGLTTLFYSSLDFVCVYLPNNAIQLANIILQLLEDYCIIEKFLDFHNEIVIKLNLTTRLKKIANFQIKSKKVSKQKIIFIKIRSHYFYAYKF